MFSYYKNGTLLKRVATFHNAALEEIATLLILEGTFYMGKVNSASQELRQHNKAKLERKIKSKTLLLLPYFDFIPKQNQKWFNNNSGIHFLKRNATLRSSFPPF